MLSIVTFSRIDNLSFLIEQPGEKVNYFFLKNQRKIFNDTSKPLITHKRIFNFSISFLKIYRNVTFYKD